MIFDLFYKIINRLHKPTNINLFKLNEKKYKMETFIPSNIIDISTKYIYNKKKDEYEVTIIFNDVPKYILYKYVDGQKNDLVLVIDNRIHVKLYNYYEVDESFVTGFELIHDKQVLIGEPITFRYKSKNECERIAKRIIDIFENMKNDTKCPNKLSYNIFITDIDKKLDIDNIVYIGDSKLNEYLAYADTNRIKSIEKTKITYGKPYYSVIGFSFNGYWLSGRETDKFNISTYKFLNNYYKISLLTNLTSNFLLPTNIRIQELQEDFHREERIEI